jgi:ParB/RepB/Spo0J family partition protein
MKDMTDMTAKRNLKTLSSGRRDMYEIDPRIIKTKPDFNVRQDYGDLEEMVAFIVANGNVPLPMKVFTDNGDIYVTDGHRRLAATMIAIERGADIKTVSCFGEPKHYNDEMRLIDMVVCNEGMRLSMLEQGIAYHRLVLRGYNQEEVSTKVGKSSAHIGKCIKLAVAPKRIQNLIIDGHNGVKVECNTVLQTLGEVEGEDAQYEALVAGMESAGENGKAKATPKMVRKAAGTGKPTVAAQMKELKSWVEENSHILAENPKYKAVLTVIDFLKAEVNLEELTLLIEEGEQE